MLTGLTQFNNAQIKGLFIFVIMSKGFLHSVAVFFLLLISLSGYGQRSDLVQFSGIIKATGTDVTVPFVTIKNTSFGNQTYMANHDGYFTFVAHKGDVIEFSSIGYQPFTITIPYVDGDKYSVNVEIQSLVEELPVVHVGPPLPWASIEEFTAEFLAINAGTDEFLNAKRNLSPEQLAALSAIVPRSAEEIGSFGSRMNHVQMNNRAMHQNALTPLMNPFAWGQLINQIKRGDFSRQKLKY